MSHQFFAGALSGDRAAVISGYSRRLLSPPLPGDGLLVVGFVEGLVGWSVSWALASNPSLAPFGLFESIVGLWIVLTAAIVAVGVRYTAPTVRRNRIWLVWAGLNGSAVAVNALALAGLYPSAVASAPVVGDLLGNGYWRPWFTALALGYLTTAGYNPSNPQLRRGERVVYALAGVACLAVLSPWLFTTPLFGPELFLVGGVLHLLPMGFDVVADVALILRRTG